MDFPELPLWVVALVLVVKTATLIYVHKRMRLVHKLAIIIPAAALLLTYTLFQFFTMPIDVQRFFGRYAIASLWIWNTVILILTRKRHVI